MKLKNYLKANKLYYQVIKDHQVSTITDNSNEVINNCIFVAIKGYLHNGIDFIDEAIDLGARTIIYDQVIDLNFRKNINYFFVEDAKVELARLLKWFYQKRRQPKMIGVTGTNGKTSTTSYLYQLLTSKKMNVLLIGTGHIISFVNNQEIKKKTRNTTVSLSKIYHSIFQNHYQYVIMELSSQGISEGRILGLEFDFICFTNITQDHLDYHLTMDNYVHEKSRSIFQLKKDGILIVNKNINYFSYLKSLVLNHLVTYSINDDADYSSKIIEYQDKMMLFKFNNTILNSSLLGMFNLENLTLVLTILSLFKFDIKQFQNEINQLIVPSGRMNLYSFKDFYVLIDFAHTPDGVYQVLKDLKEKSYHHIITIIGCGGNKDQSKRKIMGNIACKYSDMVIFTEDNSRDEKINKIINDMTCQLKTTNFSIIEEREKAILHGFELATKDDIIAILGKGNEEYIERDEFIKFSDIDFVEKLGGKRING